MIKGVHTMFYSPKAAENRAFLRDKLGFPCVDVGEGWLIFDLPGAEMGHPTKEKKFHEISFWCDDIHKTMEELKEKGVDFSCGVEDQGFGRVTRLLIPGGQEVTLYEPRTHTGFGDD